MPASPPSWGLSLHFIPGFCRSQARPREKTKPPRKLKRQLTPPKSEPRERVPPMGAREEHMWGDREETRDPSFPNTLGELALQGNRKPILIHETQAWDFTRTGSRQPRCPDGFCSCRQHVAEGAQYRHTPPGEPLAGFVGLFFSLYFNFINNTTRACLNLPPPTL